MAPTGVKLAHSPRLLGLSPLNAAKAIIISTITQVLMLILSNDIVSIILKCKDRKNINEAIDEVEIKVTNYSRCSIFASMINVFTDGASSGNPGPGGYGVILRKGPYYKEIS